MFDYAQSRHHMVESQIRTNDVTNLPLLKAFRTVPREKFIPKTQMALSYSDAHIPIGDNRWVMRPRDLAKLIQAAEINPTDVVLDIACGRGYSTAILAHLAETVVGLEDSEDRVQLATKTLEATNIDNAAIVKGDLKAGASEHGPYNAIFINGSVTEASKPWLDQLANHGRLVCVVQKGRVGHGIVFTRSGDAIGRRIVFDSSIPNLAGFEAKSEFVF